MLNLEKVSSQNLIIQIEKLGHPSFVMSNSFTIEFLKAQLFIDPLIILEHDFLKLDLSDIFTENFAIIGNFPYNISTQIIFKTLEYKDDLLGDTDLTRMDAKNKGKKDRGPQNRNSNHKKGNFKGGNNRNAPKNRADQPNAEGDKKPAQQPRNENRPKADGANRPKPNTNKKPNPNRPNKGNAPLPPKND